MSEEKQKQDFYRIVVFSVTLAFGVMAGVIQSMRPEEDYTFHFSVWTAVASIGGAFAGWLITRTFFRLSEKDKGRK